MLLIQNGRVLDPYTQMDALCDVLIGDDGVIAQVAEHIDAPAGCTVYDASGLTVSPGFARITRARWWASAPRSTAVPSEISVVK